MYTQHNRFGGSRGQRSGYQSRSNNFSRGRSRAGRFQPKPLDPRLFVSQAVVNQNEDTTNTILNSFADFNLPDKLKANLKSIGFTTPTSIQDQALKPMLEGRDLIGLADTGTGKTAAFVLPILTKLISNPNQTALIIAPTRELAVQIRDDIRSLSNGLSIYSAILIGGSNIYRQIQDIRRRPHIYIGTPGRLKDLHERGVLRLNNTTTVVLDEMDRMLDMGFIKDIQTILSFLPPVRQSLLFSATIDNRVEGIARTFMKDPLKVSVKTGNTAQNVKQDIIRASGKEKKIAVLHELLSQQEIYRKVLIFARTKFEVEKLSITLEKSGFAAGSIHGNKRQSQRERVLREFRSSQITILVATDVAARGLDVKDITHVINFDQPATYDDYVHRIGRTGRAGKTGQALTFV